MFGPDKQVSGYVGFGGSDKDACAMALDFEGFASRCRHGDRLGDLDHGEMIQSGLHPGDRLLLCDGQCAGRNEDGYADILHGELLFH